MVGVGVGGGGITASHRLKELSNYSWVSGEFDEVKSVRFSYEKREILKPLAPGDKSIREKKKKR